MSDDLIAWLRGVLDEDEREAHEYLNGGSLEEREHSMPEWRLADIGAKRAILDHAAEALRLVNSKPSKRGYDPVARLSVSLAKVFAPELEQVVRQLASAYADRPGYRSEWAPTSSTGQERP